MTRTLKVFEIHAATAFSAVTVLVEDGYAYLSYFGKPKGSTGHSRNGLLPLSVLGLLGEGSTGSKTCKSLVGSAASTRLLYSSHEICRSNDHLRLNVHLRDPQSGLEVTTHLCLWQRGPTLRASASVTNPTKNVATISQLPSFAMGNLLSTNSQNFCDKSRVWIGDNTWFGEARWNPHSLEDLGLNEYGLYDSTRGRDRTGLGFYSLSNRSTFTTEGHLPMGLLACESGTSYLWQIEQTGSWRWEMGDFGGALYLVTSGPEAQTHEWRLRLEPGHTFTSCVTAICHEELSPSSGPNDPLVNSLFATLTRYRRTLLRPHRDHTNLPIIFNDYMNCLMGDPTEDKILHLLDPVVATKAEYFVIDAGWYADDNDWWTDVGHWTPSTRRFPRGLAWLLREIRNKGMIPGLWIEPEVIGINNPLVQELDPRCFMVRDGIRIIEKGRYHLDYTTIDVRDRMDRVLDELIALGVGYFKFDYNIENVLGSDRTSSPGVGQSEHSRAYLAWIASLLDRYPDLVLENCASGGMRMDYEALSQFTLQSTSDQEDPVYYAAIAAAYPTAVIPEQAAIWAYPQPEWSDEVNALTVTNTLLARVHLSGKQDSLSVAQRKLVQDGMAVYRSIRQDLCTSVPFWPLGLPRWRDDWLALGMKSENVCYVTVWRRGGKEESEMTVDGIGMKVECIYPKHMPGEYSWADGSLRVRLPVAPCARLLRLSWD